MKQPIDGKRQIDGILADMNSMSAETFNQLVTSAFTAYIMRQEKCDLKEAVRRMGILCELTQRSLAHSIVTQAANA